MRWFVPLVFLAAACNGAPSGSGSGSSSGSSTGGSSAAGSSGGGGASSGSTGASSASGGSTSSGSSSGGMESGSLQGFQTFTPNAIFAVRIGFSDGGIENDEIEIGMFDSNPTADCSSIQNGFPLNGILAGDVGIFAKKEGPITAGTYNIIDFTTFGGIAASDGGLGAIVIGVPANPPGPVVIHVTDALSGTLTLTGVGPDWAGSFSAMVAGPTGMAAFSGSFDTTDACVLTP